MIIDKLYVKDGFYKWPCPHCKSSLCADTTPLKEPVIKCIACGREWDFVKFSKNKAKMHLKTPSLKREKAEKRRNFKEKRRIFSAKKARKSVRKK